MSISSIPGRIVATWMDLESAILSELSQTPKDKYIIHLYVKSKNK